MHPELQMLIEMALADGDVTDKKRGIILRKAESLGLDKDEVEMILDGQIALNKRSKESSMQHGNQPVSKVGDIRKCPACGAPVSSFSTKCSDCSHEFNNTNINTSIQSLFDLLQKARTLGEKEELIRNYPVPNTKEAILEFLAQGVPGAKADKSSSSSKTTRIITGYFTLGASELINKFSKTDSQSLASAWRAKCEQVIIKARFSMKEDKQTLSEIEFYAKQLGII